MKDLHESRFPSDASAYPDDDDGDDDYDNLFKNKITESRNIDKIEIWEFLLIFIDCVEVESLRVTRCCAS
jgi:hypothetical protein